MQLFFANTIKIAFLMKNDALGVGIPHDSAGGHALGAGSGCFAHSVCWDRQATGVQRRFQGTLANRDAAAIATTGTIPRKYRGRAGAKVEPPV